MRQYFMIPASRKRCEALRASLDLIDGLVATTELKEAAIAVHFKHAVARSSAIQESFGEREARRLLRGPAARGNVLWHLVTERRRSGFRRGPLIAAYVSPRLLAKLLEDERFTDICYLPWNQKDEAWFLDGRQPSIVAAPADWHPSPRPVDASDALESEPAGERAHTSRNRLTEEQRAISVEHSIDPGFVNHRRIASIVGLEGRKIIDAAVAALPNMPEWQRATRIGHIYTDVMLAYCGADVPPLGVVVVEKKCRLFCSTERFRACKDVNKLARAVSCWRSSGRSDVEVELHYSTAHITSDTLRSQLHDGGYISVIAEFCSFSGKKAVFHPLVMGGPLLTTRDPRWQNAVAWWCHEFYEQFIEDFDEFSRVKGFPEPPSCEPMRRVSEGAFKQCLAEIVGGEAPKDWGGESCDFYSPHMRLRGERVKAAFLLKGPARFAPMSLNSLGKNNDQIVRLSSVEANVLIVQHCHEILPAVRETLRTFAVQPSRPRRYCLIDGRDSLRLLQAYGLYDKAVELSAKGAGRRTGLASS
jgi:hypothetical protein